MEEQKGTTIYEEIWAKTIGRQVLKFVEEQDAQKLNQQIEGDALAVLERIRAILDDDGVDDPECFHRIEAIVDALDDVGISTGRHDW